VLLLLLRLGPFHALLLQLAIQVADLLLDVALLRGHRRLIDNGPLLFAGWCRWSTSTHKFGSPFILPALVGGRQPGSLRLSLAKHPLSLCGAGTLFSS